MGVRHLFHGFVLLFATISVAAAVPISDTPLFCAAGEGEIIATSSAFSAREATAETSVFQAGFDPARWSGELTAYPYGSAGDADAADWRASRVMPEHAMRNIFTVDDRGEAVAFRWNDLDASAKEALNDDEELLAFLRGDSNREGVGDDEFRLRAGPLGDIVHSTPAFVGDQDYDYGLLPGVEGDGYGDFVLRKKRSRDVVLVGANDGMLHVFDAVSGREVFAYVPRSLLGTLPELARRDYSHRYYVDGSPAVADAYLGGRWRTVAVTTLGRGGPGILALDLSGPAEWGADNVLWEISPGDVEGMGDPGAYLGVAMAAPAIVRAESGDWIALLGNGYNSDAGSAALIVVDLVDGEVIRVLDTGVGRDNGLAKPAAVDVDRDGSVDTVYAGDLKGNLWKFDLSGGQAADWTVAYDGAPLFTATDADGKRQPITSRPDAAASPYGGLMLVFGTGKYLDAADAQDTSIQSVYGIWDIEGAKPEDKPVDGREALRHRRATSGRVGEVGVRLLGGGSVDYSGDDARRGWVFDLDYSGERIVRDVNIVDGKAVLVSTIPSADPCDEGVHGALIEIDPLTGGNFDVPVLDLNDDGRFDSGDGVPSDADGETYRYPGLVDLKMGFASVPTILVREDGEQEKRIPGVGGNIRTFGEKGFVKPGRGSWQQIR